MLEEYNIFAKYKAKSPRLFGIAIKTSASFMRKVDGTSAWSRDLVTAYLKVKSNVFSISKQISQASFFVHSLID